MKQFLSYFEILLKMLGFKKFMWFHVTGLMMLGIYIFIRLIELIVFRKYNITEALIAFGGLTLFYVLLRGLQATFNERVKEDRYMYFWLGNKKNTKK